MKRKMLVIHDSDNVGVLLESADKDDFFEYKDGEIRILEPVEFAHKIALGQIRKDEPIFKYGEEIGYALTDIQQGQWIHNHNMGCDRGK